MQASYSWDGMFIRFAVHALQAIAYGILDFFAKVGFGAGVMACLPVISNNPVTGGCACPSDAVHELPSNAPCLCLQYLPFSATHACSGFQWLLPSCCMQAHAMLCTLAHMYTCLTLVIVRPT